MTKEYFSQFLKEQLPIAEVAGIQLKSLTESSAQTQVELSLLNQNPFKSMFWAVQGMAAELSTGVLCMKKTAATQQNISMLVIRQEADFSKKAVGNIIFTCMQGNDISQTIDKAIETKEGQIITVISEGKDETGDVVSIFKFTWSFKIK